MPTSAVHAVSPAPAPGAYPAMSRAAPRRRHKGFYLRLALGFAPLVDHVSIEDNGAHEGSETVSAFALAGELALGGVVGTSTVLGGGLYTMAALASEYDAGGSGVLLGPFMDHYFGADSGAHLLLAAGYQYLGRDEVEGTNDSMSLHGGGFMVGFGYEWWLSDSWLMGLLGRLNVGYVTGTDPSDDNEHHGDLIVSPQVLLTVTLN